jgi:hypothetical protein
MIDSTRTQRPAGRAPTDGQDLLRRISLGMLAGLLIQYGLGMIVNLYVNVPARDQGGGILTAIARALSGGPASLIVHAALGLLLIVGAVNLVVRAVILRLRLVAWLSAVSLLAITGAAAAGAAFVNAGADGASLTMALLTGVAVFCYAANLFALGTQHQAGP